MAEFPTTPEELDEYIGNYLAEHVAEVTAAQISAVVNSYMQTYGAAIEDCGENGDVPLIADNDLDADNMTIPLARLSNGVPTSFFQARARALTVAAAKLITQADVPMEVVSQTETEVEISPNVLNTWGSVESLDITFANEISGKVNEYLLQFVVDGDEFELTLPSGVKWTEEPDFEDGYTYQVSIINNLAIYAGWEDAE